MSSPITYQSVVELVAETPLKLCHVHKPEHLSLTVSRIPMYNYEFDCPVQARRLRLPDIPRLICAPGLRILSTGRPIRETAALKSALYLYTRFR